MSACVDAECAAESACVDAAMSACVDAEDTPAAAVVRARELLWLREVLLAHTRGCALVQREPGNALARFLFSSALTRGAGEDAVLPGHAARDASLCRELASAGADEAGVAAACAALCAASGAAAARVAAVQARGAEGEVFLVRLDGQYQVMWRQVRVSISAPHLHTLRRLYAEHTPQDAGEGAFTRRLFCALKRYDALGGPTFQCSVPGEAFAALEAEFGALKECFASPFNHNAEVYWSAFPDTDGWFGSRGSFFDALASPLVQEGGAFYANPPFVEEHLERLRARVEEMLALDAAVTFAVVLPTWTDTACHAWMQGSAYTRAFFVLAAGEHAYIDGRQQAETRRWRKRHLARAPSSVFVLQNAQGAAARPVNEATRGRLEAAFRRGSRTGCEAETARDSV